MIVSASRRTDIPAYYAPWLMNRLRQGFALTRNPVSPRRVTRVSLAPEEVDCLVFWSKDPAPMMEYLDEIRGMGHSFYFQFTLTPYGWELEPGLRPKNEIFDTFRLLSAQTGSLRTLWRYDPIVLGGGWTAARHKEDFSSCCARLEGFTDRCTISFVDVYAKNREMFRPGVFRTAEPAEMAELAGCFAQIGRRHGITVCACCEPADLSPYGVLPAACIDPERARAVGGRAVKARKDRNQRPGCGCAASIDLGAYGCCPAGCRYCYANGGEKTMQANLLRHDPGSPFLIGAARPDDILIERGESPREAVQLSLTGEKERKP